MPIFKSRQAQDIETVRVKLETARVELAAQEQYLRELSLDAALAENETPAVAEVQAKIAGLRSRTELLEAAIVEANRLEANRLAAARAEGQKSNLRALRAHDAAAVKGAKEFMVAAANLVAAWGRIREACDGHNKVLKLLPGDTRQREVTPLLRALALAELARADHAAGGRNAPGTPDRREYQHIVPLQHHVSETPSFATALAERLDATFKMLSGSTEQ
jgi:hypothetical protein